jgi:hypothetical protein
MVRATHHGYRVVGWSDERSRYMAVASVPQVELERLSSSLGALQQSMQPLAKPEKL